MKTGLIAITAGLAAISFSGPAFADDDRDDRHEWKRDRHYNGHDNGRWGRDDWRDDRRDEARAYRKGYRAGVRADDRRDRRYAYQSGRYYRQQAPVYYDNRGWNGYDRGYNDGYPVYRGASYRNSNPYWWGPNGQVYCRRQDGTAGLIVGALAGGTLGNVIARQGDKRLGSVIGGTLGAVLGNEIAKGNARCR
jgi:hypothetical protein